MRKAGTAQTKRLAQLGSAGIAWLVLGVLPACGLSLTGSPSSSRSPPRREPFGEPAMERAVCEARCARSIRCEGPREAVCPCRSVDDSGLLRADWARAAIACLGTTPCEATPDCDALAYRAIGVTPLSWPPVVMRCFEREATCGGSSASCRRVAAFSDAAQAEVAMCFDRACPEFTDCFDSFVATRVAPAVPSWR